MRCRTWAAAAGRRSSNPQQGTEMCWLRWHPCCSVRAEMGHSKAGYDEGTHGPHNTLRENAPPPFKAAWRAAQGTRPFWLTRFTLKSYILRHSK